jgi:hypothetical protein
MHNVLNSRQPTSQKGTFSSYSNIFRLLAEPAIGFAESEPLYDDIDVRPSTMLRAKQKGLDAHFVHLIKKISLLALAGFIPGDLVNSTTLCAEIWHGLSKGERLQAGKAIWLLADAKELSLKSLGTNTANLQQYRVK